MAHDIGWMFYYGDIPWHRLGYQLSQAATLDEGMRAGGLEWTVSLVPIVPAGEPDRRSSTALRWYGTIVHRGMLAIGSPIQGAAVELRCS